MKCKAIILLFVPVFLWGASSCKNDEAEILSYSIVGQETDVEISNTNKTVKVTFPDNVTEAGDMVAEFTLSDGATATVGNRLQVSGVSSNNYEMPFVYQVESEDMSNVLEWQIISKNNSFTLSWGLGGFQNHSAANNRPYDWYLDQASTGTYSSINCGPTSTTMAAKWSLSTFSKTPEDARGAYRPEGGWWYTSDINNYLTDNGIPHGYVALSTATDLTAGIITGAIDEGYILILCVDMYYIRNETNPDFRVDKFYTADTQGWGHFIIVKGYRVVENNLFFEIYDPNNYSRRYSDSSIKGKDRYYRAEDIFLATSNWWNYAIAVSEYGTKATGIKGLNPDQVPSMPGR